MNANRRLNELQAKARAAADDLDESLGDKQLRVAFISCSYDTLHEPVGDQVRGRIEQLLDIFGQDGRVQWSLWVVDDADPHRRFGEDVERAMWAFPALAASGRLSAIPMTSAAGRPGGLKGQALLDGMRQALEAGRADIVTYINLNLKVDARLAAPGIRQVARGYAGAAIGSRDPREGGLAAGAGRLGRLKSRGFNNLTRVLLPTLSQYRDTNAPLKVFSRDAAQLLVAEGRNPRVTMDCEWLMLLHNAGIRVHTFPIVWTQRAGSRPPWHLIPRSTLDLVAMRRRLQK